MTFNNPYCSTYQYSILSYSFIILHCTYILNFLRKCKLGFSAEQNHLIWTDVQKYIYYQEFVYKYVGAKKSQNVPSVSWRPRAAVCVTLVQLNAWAIGCPMSWGRRRWMASLIQIAQICCSSTFLFPYESHRFDEVHLNWGMWAF
jgi:hypothetical protein